MSIQVDLTQANNDPIPSGTYLAKVVKAEEKESQKGNAYINWEFDIISDDSEIDGRKFWCATVTAGKGAFKLKELLEALGMDLDGLESIDPDEFLGMEVKVTLGIRSYEQDGQMRESNEAKAFHAA